MESLKFEVFCLLFASTDSIERLKQNGPTRKPRTIRGRKIDRVEDARNSWFTCVEERAAR